MQIPEQQPASPVHVELSVWQVAPAVSPVVPDEPPVRRAQH